MQLLAGEVRVEIVPGAIVDSVAQQLHESARVQTVDTVGYADVDGFTANNWGSDATMDTGLKSRSVSKGSVL